MEKEKASDTVDAEKRKVRVLRDSGESEVSPSNLRPGDVFITTKGIKTEYLGKNMGLGSREFATYLSRRGDYILLAETKMNNFIPNDDGRIYVRPDAQFQAIRVTRDNALYNALDTELRSVEIRETKSPEKVTQQTKFIEEGI
jgi:hypothetical protein